MASSRVYYFENTVHVKSYMEGIYIYASIDLTMVFHNLQVIPTQIPDIFISTFSMQIC